MLLLGALALLQMAWHFVDKTKQTPLRTLVSAIHRRLSFSLLRSSFTCETRVAGKRTLYQTDTIARVLLRATHCMFATAGHDT